MNRGITIARKGEAFEVLIGPEVAFTEQRRNFRKLRAGLTGFDEVELWSSGQGRVKRYRFKSKVVAPVAPVREKKDTTVSEPQAPVSSGEPDAKALDAPAGSAPSSPDSSPATMARKSSGKKNSKKK